MKKRAFLFSYWVVAFSLFCTGSAYAYIDPATTTYIIQIAAAIVITLGVSLSIFLYKFQMILTSIKVNLHALQRRFRKKQESGETNADSSSLSASEETEAALTLMSEEEALAAGVINCPIPAVENYAAMALAPETADGASDDSEGELEPSGFLKRAFQWLFADSRTFKQRLPISALIAGGLAMTYGVFGMLDSVIQNETQIAFSLGEAVGPVLLFGLASFVFFTLFLSLLRGRTHNFFVCLLLSGLICSYLQSTFFNSSVGQLIGTPLTWEVLGVARVVQNLILWVFIFAVVYILGFVRKPKVERLFKQVALYVPALIIAVQLIALFSILPPTSSWNDHKRSGTQLSLTAKNIYQLSPDENVVVFILDTLVDFWIDDAIATDPEQFAGLDGFTRYTNHTSVYNSTFPSMVHAFTKVEYDPHMPSDKWTDGAFAQGTYFKDIQNEGFNVGVYMIKPYTYSDGKQLEGVAENVEAAEYSPDSIRIVFRLLKLNFLKASPLALKSTFSLPPSLLSYVNAKMEEGDPQPYEEDDPKFYNGLVSEGLHVKEGTKSFRHYHLNGPHGPWYMSSKAEYVEAGTDYLQQTLGCFYIIDEYIQQMKDLGIYENSTIIITGDHADHCMDRPLDGSRTVGLLVKPAGSFGTPLQYSNAPVSLDQLGATCVQSAGANPSKWGIPYAEVSEDDSREREFIHRYRTASGREHYIDYYTIIGDAKNFDNWKLEDSISTESKYWWG